MKKLFPILAIGVLAVGFVIFTTLSVEAAEPTGTLTGTAVVNLNVGEMRELPTLTITTPNPSDITALAATGDIRIEIPNTVNAIWNVNVTTPEFGGSEDITDKVASTISYVSTKELLIDVTEDFDAGEVLTISGLSVIGHTAASAGANLTWAVDGTTPTFDTADASTAITVVTTGPQETLTGVTVSTSNSVIEEENVTYTIQLTQPAGSVLPKDGIIELTFPANTDLSNITFAASGPAGVGTFTPNDTANVLSVERVGDGTAFFGAGAITFTIGDVINTDTAGAGNTVAVEFRTTDSELLSSGTSAAFTTLAVPATMAMTCESSGQAGAIWLRWTEPDGALGGEYTVKRSGAAILEAQWAGATVVDQTWVPGAKGLAHQELVTGLNPNTTYYFAIKTTSAGLKESVISNSPSCVAPRGSASVAADTIAPTTIFTYPASNSTVGTGAVVIRGTARDTGGSSVQKVEISLDNGTTWNQATITEDEGNNRIWHFDVTNAPVGTMTVKARATDWANNVEANGPTLTFNVSSTGTPITPGEPTIPSLPAGATADEIRTAITAVQQQLIVLIQQLILQLIAQLQAML